MGRSLPTPVLLTVRGGSLPGLLIRHHVVGQERPLFDRLLSTMFAQHLAVERRARQGSHPVAAVQTADAEGGSAVVGRTKQLHLSQNVNVKTR